MGNALYSTGNCQVRTTDYIFYLNFNTKYIRKIANDRGGPAAVLRTSKPDRKITRETSSSARTRYDSVRND